MNIHTAAAAAGRNFKMMFQRPFLPPFLSGPARRLARLSVCGCSIKPLGRQAVEDDWRLGFGPVWRGRVVQTHFPRAERCMNMGCTYGIWMVQGHLFARGHGAASGMTPIRTSSNKGCSNLPAPIPNTAMQPVVSAPTRDHTYTHIPHSSTCQQWQL